MSHIVELIAVGTELLLGNIVNSDARMLSQGLSALGLNVYYHTVVGDNPDRLRQAVSIARERADIIITTGGLGPTCDDLTKNVLAQAFGKKLVFDSRSADRIRAYFERLHPSHPMTENNLQQAMLPEGCTIFDNDWGTAPACAFEADGTHVILLPGPPRECTALFRHRVVPYLQALSEGTILSHTLKIFGIGESALESMLREKMNTMENPTLAPYAKEGEVELRVTAKARTVAQAEALLAPVCEELRALLGKKVYGMDVDNLETVVLDLLKRAGKSLGTAESCTGGLIAKRMTDLPGASQVFHGGIISYADQVKANVLQVPQALLDRYGAVSEPVAAAMAEGARQALGVDLAVSVTGVAGPDPDDRGNEVGLVYIALAQESGTQVELRHFGALRSRTRTAAASHALNMVRLAILQGEGSGFHFQ